MVIVPSDLIVQCVFPVFSRVVAGYTLFVVCIKIGDIRLNEKAQFIGPVCILIPFSPIFFARRISSFMNWSLGNV